MIRFLNVFGLAFYIIRPFCLGVDLRRPLFWFVFTQTKTERRIILENRQSQRHISRNLYHRFFLPSVRFRGRIFTARSAR